jgi:hypothetical protein
MAKDTTMNSESVQTVMESHDGEGAGDHDVPYSFGRRPRSSAPYPFSTRQYARLLVLRSEVRCDLRSEGAAQDA